MSTIRSIIVFNGGSAGDFLRTVCLEQIDNFDRYVIDKTGMVETDIEDNYFKFFCKTQQQLGYTLSIDPTRCFEIENAHSYHDWFANLTPNLFYIHYENDKTSTVVKEFIHKRMKPEVENWIKEIMPPHIPAKLVSKINSNNIEDVLSIFWTKNINRWQANSMLTPIPLQDLFDLSMLTKWVERLCDQPLTDPDRLADTYQAWLSQNSRLANALI